jgi:hypothetical protein
MDQHTCLNCGNIFTGKFCNQCGQKETHRYSVGHVMHEMVHVFTHADKGIFSFVGHILLRPGTVALHLVEGKRKRYFNLFQYLLIIVGFVTFIIIQSDAVGHTVKTINKANATKMSVTQQLAQQKTTAILQKYNNIVQLLLIPIYAFFSWLIVARKKYNFAEQLVLQAASSAQTNTLAIFTTLIMVYSASLSGLLITGLVSLAIMVASFTMCYRQFFKFSFFKSLGYALLVFVCAYITQTLLIGGVIVLIAVAGK